MIPFVEARYRAAPFRILLGQSAGGWFTLHLLFEHPGTFQACIASSPAAWWDDSAILQRVGPVVGRPGQFLFITLEAPQNSSPYQQAVHEVVKTVRARAHPGLIWEFKGYDAEWHGSVYHPSVNDALRFLYPDWNFVRTHPVNADLTYEQVADHYAKLGQRYGYPIPVPLVSLDCIGREPVEASVITRVYEGFLAQHPESAGAHLALGRVLLRHDDPRAALPHYEKAVELAPDNADALRIRDELREELKKPQ